MRVHLVKKESVKAWKTFIHGCATVHKILGPQAPMSTHYEESAIMINQLVNVFARTKFVSS